MIPCLDEKDPSIYPLAYYRDEGTDIRVYALYIKPGHALFYNVSDATGDITEIKKHVSEALDPNAWTMHTQITEKEFWSNIL